MDAQNLSLIAGGISSFLFISGNVPMLAKAAKTRDLSSYSLGNLLLVNVGDLVYWLYIVGLPFGPIWLLHSFYTVVEILMLLYFVRYQLVRAANNARPSSVAADLLQQEQTSPGAAEGAMDEDKWVVWLYY